MYKAYTYSPPKDIDTLKELDKSGLKITASSPLFQDTFGDDHAQADILSSLRGKLFLEFSDLSKVDQVANFSNVCTLERLTDVTVMIQTRYYRPDGSPKVHVVSECPRHYFLTYIVSKDWPLQPRFNKLLMRFAEGGLLFTFLIYIFVSIDDNIRTGFGHLWYKQMEHALVMEANTAHRYEFYQSPLQAFTLQHIRQPFHILMVGYVIALVVFLFERFILTPGKFGKIISRIQPVRSIQRDFRAYRCHKSRYI